MDWESTIRRREPAVRAFTWIDLDRARRLAASASPGSLAGAWVGIKDVIDTAGIPTERGSELFRGRVPATSATVVERIEAAGGVVAGKTVTAELASARPGPTTNPWDPTRTPGGSSMGSAAAVAAGMLPLAVGTQTAGSVIRPAAFCGVVGFKPSLETIPLQGVMLLSGTIDQLGAFATSVEAAAQLASVMAGTELAAGSARRPPRLGLYRSPEWDQLEPAARDCIERVSRTLRAAGATVSETVAPDGFDGCLPVHRCIVSVEIATNLGAEVALAPELVSDGFRRRVAEGRATPAADYRDALAERQQLMAELSRWAEPFDGLLCPAAMGEAPGLETTGDPRPCARWSLTGAPAITLPAGRGPAGLPIGVQLCGAPGSDGRLLAAAAWAEAVLGLAEVRRRRVGAPPGDAGDARYAR